MLKMKDIERRMTEITTEYISKGMWFSCETMNGHQGEEGKVDVTDGKKVYRVLLTSDCGWGTAPKMILQVRVYDMPRRGWTVWNNDGEVILEEVYYDLSERNKNAYTTNKFFAEHERQIRIARYDNRNHDAWQKSSIKPEKVMSIVRSRRGYKKVTPDMVSVERDTEKASYKIRVSGKADIYVSYKEVR